MLGGSLLATDSSEVAEDDKASRAIARKLSGFSVLVTVEREYPTREVCEPSFAHFRPMVYAINLCESLPGMTMVISA